MILEIEPDNIKIQPKLFKVFFLAKEKDIFMSIKNKIIQITQIILEKGAIPREIL
ncbi:MAG: hypothetical protein ACD_11C00116G0024 [uncultured bacterium]|nr:MAG: hypothetical protein ACD_11C00116G0024 [uncultured bacterium]